MIGTEETETVPVTPRDEASGSGSSAAFSETADGDAHISAAFCVVEDSDDEKDSDYNPDDDDDESSEFEQNPALFVLSGVDTSLDEIVLEDCLTNALVDYDISNDESGDGDEDEDNFLPSIMVTLLETDYNDTKGTILFCVDRSLVMIGDDNNNGGDGNGNGDDADDVYGNGNVNTANEDVLRRIREYLLRLVSTSDPYSGTDFVWIADASNATIEIVEEVEVGDEAEAGKPTEKEAYDSWLKQNEAEGGDNTLVEPAYLGDEKEEAHEE